MELGSSRQPGYTNLWASIHKEHSRVLLASLQVVRFIHHAVQLEARLPREVEDLWWVVISRAT